MVFFFLGEHIEIDADVVQVGSNNVMKTNITEDATGAISFSQWGTNNNIYVKLVDNRRKTKIELAGKGTLFQNKGIDQLIHMYHFSNKTKMREIKYFYKRMGCMDIIINLDTVMMLVYMAMLNP